MSTPEYERQRHERTDQEHWAPPQEVDYRAGTHSAPIENVTGSADRSRVTESDAGASGRNVYPENPLYPGNAVTSQSDPKKALSALRQEISKVVVGQDSIVTGLLIGLLCQGHILLEGVPGVAKTLLVRTLARALELNFKRLQFTPDLMPGDVTGSQIFDSRTAEFIFREGPVFTNFLLADEVNRTPPKTQAALLEAMEERQVSVEGVTRPLPTPFIVAATQNPVEHEGTYPLPEAQLDRFLLKLVVPLPQRHEEIGILEKFSSVANPRDITRVQPVASIADLAQGKNAVRNMHVSPEVMAYIVDVVRATRQSPAVQLGVSPRGATALLAASRAWAWLSDRTFVTPDDVKTMALPTLRHRISLRPEADLEGISSDRVVEGITATVPVPR